MPRRGPRGRRRRLTVPSRALRATVDVGLWSPAGAPPSAALPLLLVHDGPDYQERTDLTRWAAEAVADGRLPAHRMALLAPGERDDWYSANPAYARAVAADVLPALRRAVAVAGPVVDAGTSLGALSLLHLHRRFPALLGALFLQSGSYFLPR